MENRVIASMRLPDWLAKKTGFYLGVTTQCIVLTLPTSKEKQVFSLPTSTVVPPSDSIRRFIEKRKTREKQVFFLYIPVQAKLPLRA